MGGSYGLIGAIIPEGFDEFIVYPNPFKPVRGDEYIFFEGLPENSRIRIYDIAGNLIKEAIDKEAIWEWDVRDKEGKKVDSGIYIYIVTTDEGLKRIGKIGVIR
ncbi:MAG: T9SS type A sorting domain-containing protein [bacterium]